MEIGTGTTKRGCSGAGEHAGGARDSAVFCLSALGRLLLQSRFIAKIICFCHLSELEKQARGTRYKPSTATICQWHPWLPHWTLSVTKAHFPHSLFNMYLYDIMNKTGLPLKFPLFCLSHFPPKLRRKNFLKSPEFNSCPISLSADAYCAAIPAD